MDREERPRLLRAVRLSVRKGKKRAITINSMPVKTAQITARGADLNATVRRGRSKLTEIAPATLSVGAP